VPDSYAVRAAAKVNLVLRVGPARPDGFHDLATLMVPLDLADEVRVTVSPGRAGPVTCRVPGWPDLDGPSNLAARAAEAFRARFGVAGAVDLRIAKRIPVVAGLGGGSSDAAATLRALALAYRVRDAGALHAIALAIGSDVPFFLGPGPAWAAGRGERLTPAAVGPLHLVLVYPKDPRLAIRAGDAYRWLDESRAGQERVRRPRIPATAHRAFRAQLLENDLESGCFTRHPELAALAARLVGEGATRAILSGSGPTVFGTFPHRAAARRAAERLAGQDSSVEVHAVRTLQRHPGVSRWTSPRSASSPSTRRSSRRT
jgi:4-diphosphocytidyl-2-C-methyl-D-erythritol kinase